MGQAVLFISINQNSFNNRSNIEKRIYNKKKKEKRKEKEKNQLQIKQTDTVGL